MCGLSGAGKTTIASHVKEILSQQGVPVEVLDGDEYRSVISKDLGFSKEDRNENIRRLAYLANKFSQHHIVSIICAINPYDNIREEVKKKYKDVYTVFIDCDLEVLFKRDTKQLYKRTLLNDYDKNKLKNLSGVNDTFEKPEHPDLTISTSKNDYKSSSEELVNFILQKTNY